LQSENAGNPKAGKQGATTLRPTSMQSCALDVADRGATVEQIAEYLDCDPSRVRQISQAAGYKLAWNLLEHGVDVETVLDIVNAIEPFEHRRKESR
jgi:hypothetical protein